MGRAQVWRWSTPRDNTVNGGALFAWMLMPLIFCFLCNAFLARQRAYIQPIGLRALTARTAVWRQPCCSSTQAAVFKILVLILWPMNALADECSGLCGLWLNRRRSACASDISLTVRKVARRRRANARYSSVLRVFRQPLYRLFIAELTPS